MLEFYTLQKLSLNAQWVLLHLHLINIPCNFPSTSRQTMLILSYLMPMAHQKKKIERKELVFSSQFKTSLFILNISLH